MENHIFNRLKLLEGSFFKHTESKAGAWLNYKLIKVEPGYIEVQLEVREAMTNPNGMLHGGMSAMICDEICGLAFFSLGIPTNYTTVNLALDYLLGAAQGEKITAIGKVLRQGKRLANVEGYIYNDKKQIIVHATTNLLNTEKPVFNLIETNHA